MGTTVVGGETLIHEDSSGSEGRSSEDRFHGEDQSLGSVKLPREQEPRVREHSRDDAFRIWFRLFLGISGGALAIAVALGLVVVLTSAAAQAAPGGSAAESRKEKGRGGDHGRGSDGRDRLDGRDRRDDGDRREGRSMMAALDNAEPPEEVLHRLQAHQGSGMILMGDDGPSAAPLQSTDALLRVTGNTVRATVTQRFLNPGSGWMEGSYRFPLPDDAAVDHLRMKVGDHVVRGEIREKEAARRDFAGARVRGQRASLVEQQRPNVFTTGVTGIAPGAIVEIELQYQQTLALRDGAWRLSFPGVVAPRYGGPSRGTTRDGEGGAATFQENDLLRLSSASLEDPLNPIRITVDLDPGIPIVEPASATHRLQHLGSVTRRDGNVATRTVGDRDGGGSRYRLQTIADDDAHEVADRDFVLEWSPAVAKKPMATLRHERHGEHHYGMLVINPPSPAVESAERLTRELTFVVDTSGSMAGESLEQARSALSFGLERLQADDWFNIIQFNSSHSSLFPEPRPATEANLRQARRHVRTMRADGGTEMRGAIAQALAPPLPAGLLGQVVFITDGAVDYEDELVSLVRDRLGSRRLFTVGIGSGPNGFFMRKAAEIGGGTFTFIGDTGEVESRMSRLFQKIAHPMSTDLAVAFEGGALAEPITVPRDLYAGEPLILTARFARVPRTVTVSGTSGAGENPAGRWRISAAVTSAPESGLHVLWARSRIEALSDAIRQARHTTAPQDDLRKKVLSLALDHHLVSAYTSLVAVDPAAVRPAVMPMDLRDVPLKLPAGWDPEVLNGEVGEGSGGSALARTATTAAVQLLIGSVLLALGFMCLLSHRGSRLLAGGAGR
jgi:Ca-activated chloride channel family protein